jgi:hypothetical protein
MARKIIQDMRDEEMVFLGMDRGKDKQRATTAPDASNAGARPMAGVEEDPMATKNNQKQVNKWIQAGN